MDLLFKAVIGTILCFVPYILFRFISGQFVSYQPLSVLMTEDVLQSDIPVSIIGMIIIAVAWGFFEGFNYAVIADIINKRYPTKKWWIDIGAIVCAIMCVVFHPFSTSVFAFCLIWNAI